jgi:hypothetical protein
MSVFRHPEVRAISAFTRVFDAPWRASKGDGTQIGYSRSGHKNIFEIGKKPISSGASAASFEGRFAATSG